MSNASPVRAVATPAQPSLRVRTLGGFVVWRGEEPIPPAAWARRKVVALLTLLLGSPGYRRHRAEIIDALWPEAAAESGANNLRVTLHRLRAVLDLPGARCGHLRAEGDIVALAPLPDDHALAGEAGEWLDAAAFAHAATTALAGRDLAACRAAQALYTGDYLPDLRYDAWVDERREELGQQYLALLLHGARLAIEGHDDREAEHWLTAVWARDRCHEGAARGLMRLYARTGRRGEALHVFEVLSAAMHAELDQPPDRKTLALAGAIRENRLAAERAEAKSVPARTEQVDPALAVTAPTVGSEAAPASNLPVPISSFIGRERPRADVVALLEQHRLVTLTGPGGVGKTRLALEVASALRPSYRDGVWLVELAPLSGASEAGTPLAGQAIAAALGLHEEAERPILATLTDALRAKTALLVLDNCEHLVAACAVLAGALLRACPDLRILASSRERLGVTGEAGYVVAPLAAPDPAKPPTPEALAEYEAVALFVARARERRPAFALTSATAPAVATICTRLDGIPLALELAAARLGTMPIEEIASRLGDRFRLLSGGPRTAEPRQRTLRAALDWSYALLGEPERRLLARLAVFAGGLTLSAAEAVCAGGDLETWLIMDLLDALVNRSLVVLDGDRYRLLETIRQYGWEKLEEAGEATTLRERHLAWCLALAEQADKGLHGPEQDRWLAFLDAEYDNVRTALDWSVRHGVMEQAGGRLAAALSPYWEQRGHLAEGRAWLEAAGAGAAAPIVRARALAGAAYLAIEQGDLAWAETLHAESLALRRELGDARAIAQSLFNLGRLRLLRADAAGAIAALEESLALARDLGDPWGLFTITNALGQAARARRDYGRARTLHEEALTLARETGAPRAIAMAANNLGIVLADLGNRAGAHQCYEEALALHRGAGDHFNVAGTLVNLAEIAVTAGDSERARALYVESLTLFRDLDARPGIASCLEGLAEVALCRDDAARSATLLGAAERLRETTGALLGPDEQTRRDSIAAGARARLGTGADDTWAAGRTLAIDKAISIATGECHASYRRA